MVDISIDDLKLWIDEIMKNEGEDSYELNISGNGTKGDGYMGEITFVTVQTGTKKDYDFAIKSAKKSDKLREQTPIKDAYLREILLYNKIFPVFEQLQLEYSIQEPFNKYPKCYKVCEEEKKETVVFENLRSKGFELHNRRVTMNLDHIRFVCTQYAHFHALSMALKQLKPELFRTLTENIDEISIRFVLQIDLLSTYREYVTNALKLLSKSKAKKFEEFESELERILTKTTYDKEDPYTVVLHGDCWNNNFMFKYDKTDKSKPIDVRFLDFQISRVSHPIYDLSYFLYVCCGNEILANFDSLLELYHNTLSDSLSRYGINVNDFFSLEKLKEDWKTVGKYGLYVSILVIQFALNDDTNAPDFAEVAEKDEGFSNSLITMRKNNESYNERVKAILEHFCHKFL